MTQVLWTDCPCCLAIRGMAVGIPIGIVIGIVVSTVIVVALP